MGLLARGWEQAHAGLDQRTGRHCLDRQGPSSSHRTTPATATASPPARTSTLPASGTPRRLRSPTATRTRDVAVACRCLGSERPSPSQGPRWSRGRAAANRRTPAGDRHAGVRRRRRRRLKPPRPQLGNRRLGTNFGRQRLDGLRSDATCGDASPVASPSPCASGARKCASPARPRRPTGSGGPPAAGARQPWVYSTRDASAEPSLIVAIDT